MEFNSEDYVTQLLNYVVKYKNYVFEWLVNDEDDETYIPKVDFDYTIIDCKENSNLNSTQVWRELMEREDPLIFTNTTYLFNQFKNAKMFNQSIEDGAQAFAQCFYFFFRDKMWQEKKIKFIFLVTEENIDKMYQFVNSGFSIELIPRCFKKDRIKEDEKIKKIK